MRDRRVREQTASHGNIVLALFKARDELITWRFVPLDVDEVVGLAACHLRTHGYTVWDGYDLLNTVKKSRDRKEAGW